MLKMATEEEEDDRSLLALFSPGSFPSMAEFCENLSRRWGIAPATRHSSVVGGHFNFGLVI